MLGGTCDLHKGCKHFKIYKAKENLEEVLVIAQHRVTYSVTLPSLYICVFL